MPSVEAPIVEVAVYTDRARVTRRGTTHLAPGEHTLTVDNLPASLLEDSVRATGRGAGVTVQGVEVSRQYVTQAPEEDLAALRTQLETLQDRDRELADDDSAESERLDFLGSLRENSSTNLPRGISQGRAEMDDVVAFARYLSNETQAVLARRREIAQKRRELAREIEAVQRRLSQRRDSILRYQVTVAVEASEETDFELELIYSTTGASWEPLYDVRLLGNKVTLNYLANVRQQTGEDWPAVKLSLSTARPALSTEIPELDPWFLDVYRPPVPVPRAMPAMAPMAAPMAMRAAADVAGPPTESLAAAPAPPPRAKTALAEVESAGAAVTYRVDRPVDVPSDGSPHKTTITSVDLEVALDYVTVPKLAEEAYLRAKIRNNSPLILLPGSANIFHGDEYVGRTRLETVVPNEEFEAQMGVDDRVKVERKLSERTAGKAFIGNTRRTGLGYKITVTSHLEWPTKVTVYDQLPVSRHELIKVKLVEAAPPPAEQTDLQILKWVFDLQPGQKQEIAFAFTVEQPRDMQVTGMVD